MTGPVAEALARLESATAHLESAAAPEAGAADITILGWRDWSRQNRRARLDLDRGPHFDRSFMAIRAAVDSLGVCLDSMLLAEQAPAAGAGGRECRARSPRDPSARSRRGRA
jgi:LysR family glycine cleavage system transcriptional activator